MATWKLVEQDKIAFDTPVADYFTEFRNPIIVDRTETHKTRFEPAQTVVALKHLLQLYERYFLSCWVMLIWRKDILQKRCIFLRIQHPSFSNYHFEILLF